MNRFVRAPRRLFVRAVGPFWRESVSALRFVGLTRAARAGYLSSGTVRALQALARGDHAGSRDRVDRLRATNRSNPVAEGVRARAAQHLGNLEDQLSSIAKLREAKDTQGLKRREATVLGRLRDSDPDWLPLLDEGPPIAPAAPNRVMHLHKAALPEVQSGYTLRSRYVVRSQQAAGLDPFIVTAPEFVRSARQSEALPDDEVPREHDGIRSYHLVAVSSRRRVPLDTQLQRTAEGAGRILLRERPALIHAASGFRGYDLAVPAIALGRRYDIPVVYEMRGFFEETWQIGRGRGNDAPVTARRFAREQRTILDADAVVTIADLMRDELVARGIPAEHITVVPNAIDASVFTPQSADPELRQQLRLGDRPVIGYVSTLDHPREGVDVLLEATARLVRDGVSVTCLIVGDGQLRPGLEEQARRLGIADSVVFTGRVPHKDVPRYYALIDLFVVPRRVDRAGEYTTPLKPFEAMAMERPLLLSDLRALAEISGNGERGVSFRAEDPGSLASEARKLLENPARRAALGEAGRTWVVRERTWEANGKRYRELFDRVLAEHRRAPKQAVS